LVDIQYMPFFQRYLGPGRSVIPATCERLNIWLDMMEKRDSFVGTATDRRTG